MNLQAISEERHAIRSECLQQAGADPLNTKNHIILKSQLGVMGTDVDALQYRARVRFALHLDFEEAAVA